MPLVVDTGPLLASLDRADPEHEACVDLLGTTTEDRVIPTLVLAEVDYWCDQRLGTSAWLSLLDDILGGAYRVEHPTPADLSRCRVLQAQYSDLQLGVVDASVIALLERLDEEKVATLDRRHFSVVRPVHTAGFRILP